MHCQSAKKKNRSLAVVFLCSNYVIRRFENKKSKPPFPFQKVGFGGCDYCALFSMRGGIRRVPPCVKAVFYTVLKMYTYQKNLVFSMDNLRP